MKLSVVAVYKMCISMCIRVWGCMCVCYLLAALAGSLMSFSASSALSSASSDTPLTLKPSALEVAGEDPEG